MSMFTKAVSVALVAATLGTGAIATSAPAAARGWGAPVAVGVIGGLAAGAIIGSAIGPGYGYGGGYGGVGYGGGYGYAPAYAPVYGPAPVPAYGPCYHSRTPVYDAYGNFAGYRGVRVCN